MLHQAPCSQQGQRGDPLDEWQNYSTNGETAGKEGGMNIWRKWQTVLHYPVKKLVKRCGGGDIQRVEKISVSGTCTRSCWPGQSSSHRESSA